MCSKVWDGTEVGEQRFLPMEAGPVSRVQKAGR